MMTDNTEYAEFFRLLSVDALRYDGQWLYNNWHCLSEHYLIENSLTNRNILKSLRNTGHLAEESKGRLSVEDVGIGLEIRLRGTREPILQLEYKHSL